MEPNQQCKTDCGNCCQFIIVQIANPTISDDYKRWVEYHNIDIIDKEGYFFLKINTPCKNYNNGCTIYEDRPDICKNYFCANYEISNNIINN